MASALPLVSIGMPVFNTEKTITRALDSLLAQTYPNFEIIVSDNYSTDKTAQICKVYAQKDNRIKLSINKKNLGIIANFRIVQKKAKGKYFFWAAGDDFWKPGFIRTLVNELEANPGVGVAQGTVRREYPDGSLKDIIKFDGKYNPNRLSNFGIAANLLSPKKKVKPLKYNLFICGLFNSKAIQEAFAIGDEVFSYGDRPFLSQIALAYRFHYVDEELFVKRVYKQKYKIRNPNDTLAQTKKNLTYKKYYYNMMVWITKAHNIPWRRKLFVFVILYYITYKFMSKLKKKFVKRLG